MKADSYKRFLNSSIYQEMLDNVKIKPAWKLFSPKIPSKNLYLPIFHQKISITEILLADSSSSLFKDGVDFCGSAPSINPYQLYSSYLRLFPTICQFHTFVSFFEKKINIFKNIVFWYFLKNFTLHLVENFSKRMSFLFVC